MSAFPFLSEAIAKTPLKQQKFKVIKSDFVAKPGEVFTGDTLFCDQDLAWFWVPKAERPNMKVGDTKTVQANSGSVTVERVPDDTPSED